jgi:hypothetical protein
MCTDMRESELKEDEEELRQHEEIIRSERKN